MKAKIRKGTNIVPDPAPVKKVIVMEVKVMIYPKEHTYIRFFRPNRSMTNMPIKVAIRLVTPIPTDESSATLAPIPVSMKILGA